MFAVNVEVLKLLGHFLNLLFGVKRELDDGAIEWFFRYSSNLGLIGWINCDIGLFLDSIGEISACYGLW